MSDKSEEGKITIDNPMSETEQPEQNPTTDDAGFKMRIVETGVMPASQFLAHPDNWKIHPPEQREAVHASLSELGWLKSVTINKRTGHIVDGHERVWQALQQGDGTMVPYEMVDISEAEEALALAILDPLAHMARGDAEALQRVMDEIDMDNEILQDVINRSMQDALLLEIEKQDGDESQLAMGPEIKISPEIFERQDYLVFYFDNDFDWQVACQKFGVETTESGPVGKRTIRHKGLGRVLDGRLLISGGEDGQ